MGKVVNAYTVLPDNLQQGDVALFTVKVVMIRKGCYRIYRCEHNPEAKEIPQGARIANEAEVCQALFPAFYQVAKPDTY